MTDLTLCFDISCEDNLSWMYRGQSHGRCDKCGLLLDRTTANPNFELKNKAFDLSSTYDNRLIASDRFRRFCDDSGYSEVAYVDLPSEPGWYMLLVDPMRMLEFDSSRRRTRFGPICDQCEQYSYAAGAHPAYLKGVEQPLLDGFYRSDIEFGSGDELSPLLFCGIETKEKLLRANFRDIDFEPVRNS